MKFASLITLLAMISLPISASKRSDIDAIIQENARVEIKDYQLMLVGGGLNTCSSLSQGACLSNDYSEQDKQQNLYQFSPQRLGALKNSRPFLQQSENYQQDLAKVLQHIYARLEDKQLTRDELRTAFDRTQLSRINGALFYDEIPGPLFDAMLDHLEVPQLDEQGKRKRERVALDNNSNRYARFLYRQFVLMAKSRLPGDSQAKPIIAVITASSRDPFESADFYQSVFEQAGAEVIWLPLDKSYQDARELEAQGLPGCARLSEIRAANGSFNREALYTQRAELQQQYCQQPDRMAEQLGRVQGVFFNGGDQSRTLAALTQSDGSDSPELALIKQRFAAHQLVVGGTSAGTAVQSGGLFAQRPVPMISSGTSEMAFRRGAFAAAPPPESCANQQVCANGLMGADLTYKALGGSGLFSLGILDTHFSERDREARLALLASATETRFAFGVDEATALLMGKTDGQTKLAVLGQGGVFMLDMQRGIYKIQDQKRQVVGMSHYLNHGDTAGFDSQSQTLHFDLNPSVPEPTAKQISDVDHPGQWRRQLLQNCSGKTPVRWQQDGIAQVVMPTEDTRFVPRLVADRPQCSYINLAFGLEN
ncbi:cyanophycinase [Bowmanella dokdonensis]|uniref:Cyanophycinase n=1 Tax=Bowmanella dokdonensis TaxID=751969 RepID=A0A939IQK0_9ALTE|nr:cyanophycinase [Bowmanella dokdonensis]MBN7825119.1 cyanophycinase [Bowmanella dokdonensis]